MERTDDDAAAGPRRELRRDGARIDVMVFVEVRDWLTHYFRSRGHARKAAGIRESSGELMGAGPAMSRLVAWSCTLNDDDLERIQAEGAAVLAALAARPPDYGKVPGRPDPVAIGRREGSVFLAPSSAPPYVPPPGLRAVAVVDRDLNHDGGHVQEQGSAPKPGPARGRGK